MQELVPEQEQGQVPEQELEQAPGRELVWELAISDQRSSSAASYALVREW